MRYVGLLLVFLLAHLSFARVQSYDLTYATVSITGGTQVSLGIKLSALADAGRDAAGREHRPDASGRTVAAGVVGGAACGGAGTCGISGPRAAVWRWDLPR